jgi:hypothetical protein
MLMKTVVVCFKMSLVGLLVTYRRFWIGGLHLLPTYTLHSELQQL